MPLALTTATATKAPAGPGGVVHVIVASSTTVTSVAALPPKVTVGGPAALTRKPLPARVTAVPPSEVPAPGTTAVRVGSGW